MTLLKRRRQVGCGATPLVPVEVGSVEVVGQLALAVRATRLLGLIELALALLDFALRLQTSLLGVGALGVIGRRLAVLLVGRLAAFALVLVSLVVHATKVATERRIANALSLNRSRGQRRVGVFYIEPTLRPRPGSTGVPPS